MADTTLPIPSRRTPFIDRFRAISDEWWPWMQKILAQVRQNSSDLDSVQIVVDQLNNSYAVSVNANGRVTGAIKLDGSGPLSSFAVLADHFIIVHPSVDGTTIQAFITGLVNGVSTVGVNGNLFVDGSILARSLSVSQLSAIAADIGTCTAGVVQSSDGKFVIDLNNKTLTITT